MIDALLSAQYLGIIVGRGWISSYFAMRQLAFTARILRRLVPTTLMLVALTVFTAGPAIAQSLSIDHYVHTAWRRSELKLRGTIRALAQTRDGYLWVGTDTGLFRFDGVRARPWHPPLGSLLPSERISSLGVSRDGTLWIGTANGLATWNNRRLTTRADIPAREIRSVFEDSRGTVWLTLASPRGVCAVRADTSRCDAIDDRKGLERAATFAVFEDRRGIIWVGDHTGLWHWAPGPPKQLPLIHSLVRSLAEDENGNLVVSTDSGIVRLSGDSVRPFSARENLDGYDLLRSRDGAIWVTTFDAGLLHLHQGRVERFGVGQGLSSDIISDTFEDREGNVWLGTEGGLDRFRLAATEVVSSKRGIMNPVAMSVVATRDSSIWIGTRAGLKRWRNGSVTEFHLPPGSSVASPGLPIAVERTRNGATGADIEAIGVDADGHLWARSEYGGMAYFDHGRFRSPSQPLGSDILLVVPGDRGATWVSDAGEVREWLPSGKIRNVDGASLITQRGGAAALVFEGRTRSVWVGFSKGGLARFADGHLQKVYDSTEGLVPGRVRHLRLDSTGAVWAVTSIGVSRVDTSGHVRTLNASTGLSCSPLDWSHESEEGTLWLSGACGLVRISTSELSAWRRHPDHVVQASVFGEYEGVTPPFGTMAWLSGPARTADGRLWFVAGDGIEILDPRHVPVNEQPPTARIEEVTADGSVYDPDTATRNRLELPARVRNLEIQYSGSSLVIPERVHFRFKLEGQDPEWREVVNQRRVEYSNLRPGTYHFRLMASNNNGVWSAAAASLRFHVPPAWNQTWLFDVLIAAAIAASAAAGATAWQRQRAQARFDATLAERTRVARELHDTLLGDMAGVAMQLSAGAKRTEVPGAESPAIAELLSSLSKQVQDSLTEARRAVTAMRTENGAASVPLHTQIADAATQIFAGSEIVSRITHTGTPRQHAPGMTAHIVTIAMEAMTNARRHAHCRTVTISCEYTERTLLVSIRDDGSGFDSSQAPPAGHWGIVGMRERATAVGATLTVSSAPHSGTEVRIEVRTGR